MVINMNYKKYSSFQILLSLFLVKFYINHIILSPFFYNLYSKTSIIILCLIYLLQPLELLIIYKLFNNNYKQYKSNHIFSIFYCIIFSSLIIYGLVSFIDSYIYSINNIYLIILGIMLPLLFNNKYHYSNIIRLVPFFFLFTFGMLIFFFFTTNDISLFAIFQTGCRGAYLALFAIFLSFLAISYRIVFFDFAAFKHLKKIWFNFTSATIGLGVIGLAFMPKIWHRLLSVFLLRGDSSTSFRMNVYQSSWQMFTDNPIFGIGPGNHTFREIYGYYMITGFDALGAYSVPLEIAVETGVLGFISFFAFVGILLWQSVKYICQDQSIRGKIYVSVCSVSIIGVMAHGLFDTVFFRPQVQFIFWTTAAILNGVLSKKEICTNKKITCV